MAKENPRVLIIEDNIIDITKLLLKIHHFTSDITFTTTAESGLSIINGSLMMDRPYDILLTDILLPGKSGKELIGEIREIEKGLQHSHLKIIAMSADDPKAHVLEACRLGAGCYLQKPITEAKLREALGRTGLFSSISE